MADTSAWEDDPHLDKSNQQSDWLKYLALTTDYISLPICAVSVLADILLITVILKYNRLRTRTNYYLINFAVFHVLYIVSTPIFYVIIDTFYTDGVEVRWYCTWSKVENFGVASCLTFVAGFGLDVVIEKWRPHWFDEYQRRYLYVYGFFYFLHSMIYAISVAICFKSGLANGFNFYFITVYYLLTTILLLYLGINNKDGRFVRNKAYALNISIFVHLLWLPLFVCYNLIALVKEHKIEVALWYMAFLPEYLAYVTSVVVVWKLWKNNKLFRTAFKKIFRRHVSLSDYEELFVKNSKDTEIN